MEKEGIETCIFAGVEPEPSVETTDAVAMLAREHDCQLVVGLGGGSCMDVAKAVSIEKAMREQLWIRALDGRMPFGKVLVAIANKPVRQVWAMLAPAVNYDPHARLQHPMHQQSHAA